MTNIPAHRRPPLQFLVRSALCAAAVALFSVALQACNTTEGAGRDVKSLGKGIEEAASDAKD